MSQFLDAAYPQSAAQFIGALKAGNQQGFTFYIGGDIALNPWPIALVNEVRAQYPGMAIHVPDLDAGDGAEAVALAHAYGLPAGYKIALDIEPSIFRGKSLALAASLANEWCDAVRAAGFSPVLYGTAATCADCANHADFIWLTVPGVSDPNAAGLAPAFFANRRAIQYAHVALNGVSCDVSNSQYSLSASTFGAGGAVAIGGDNLTTDDLNLIHDTIQDDLWGLVDTSAQSRADFAFAIGHGTSVAAIVAGWKANAQYAKWQAAKATIGQAAPTVAGGMTPAEIQQLAEVDSLVAIANAMKAELDAIQAKLDAAGKAL